MLLGRVGGIMEWHEVVKEMAWYVHQDKRVGFISRLGGILEEIRTGKSEGPYVADVDHAVSYCIKMTRHNLPDGLQEMIKREVGL